jgi:hypothetical protein
MVSARASTYLNVQAAVAGRRGKVQPSSFPIVSSAPDQQETHATHAHTTIEYNEKQEKEERP